MFYWFKNYFSKLILSHFKTPAFGFLRQLEEPNNYIVRPIGPDPFKTYCQFIPKAFNFSVCLVCQVDLFHFKCFLPFVKSVSTSFFGINPTLNKRSAWYFNA